MAFAIASGGKPESGIYTAIIAGFTVFVFGGSRVQIAGPTGAFIVILSGITAKYGFAGLQMATLMAGVFSCYNGGYKLGGLRRVYSLSCHSRIHSFKSALLVFFGQWKRFFFGLQVSMAGLHHFHQKLWCLFNALPDMNMYTALLRGRALVLYTPIDIARYLPSPLVSMLVGGIDSVCI